jgi:threonine/homoserine/homoserine lactone efflux protein
MTPFVEGALAGYGIAIPVGAIAVLIVSAGMRCGFPTGFMAGAGAATADLIYALLATIAGAAISRALAPIALPLRVLGGLLLVFLAVWGLRQGWAERKSEAPAAGAPCWPGQAYLQFLGLTIINPLTVIYFTALILGRDAAAASYSVGEQLLFVVGAGLASLSWQTALAVSGTAAHARVSGRFRRNAVAFGNLVVLALGLRILVLVGVQVAGA